MIIDVLRHKFCFIIYCTCYILLFIACCPITDIYGGRGVFCFTARWRTGIVPTLITIYVSPLAAYIGYTHLTLALYVRVFIFNVFCAKII